MHRLRLAGCFLCCVVHMYGGHFRYKKIIPQQVKGKNKWLKSITCWGCLWWTFTVKNRSVCLVTILTVMNRTLQCASFFQILCCVCSEDIMALIWNFLKSQACIQNTLQLVNSSYHCFDQWKCRLIIQKVNKTQLKLGVCAIQTLTASIKCSSTPKSVKWNPRKTNIWKWHKLFLSSGTVFQEVTKERSSSFCRI